MADCGALRDATANHKRYANDADTAAAAVLAGVDSNCGSVFPAALPDAIGNGTLHESQLENPFSFFFYARIGFFSRKNKLFRKTY